MIKIRNIANCGLLIKTEKARILIDALNDKAPGFSSISLDDVKAIYNGTGDFSNIDCMLFTHCHPDHYDRKKVLRCLRSSNVRRIYLPDKAEYEALTTGTQNYLSLVQANALNMKLGETSVLSIEDLKVMCIRNHHSGREHYEVQHYSYYVQANGKGIYISGDCDFSDNNQWLIVSHPQVVAAFFNPYYLSSLQGRKLLHHSQIRKIYIYHIPAERDDSLGIRDLAERCLRRYSSAIPECSLVLSCGEWIELE